MAYFYDPDIGQYYYGKLLAVGSTDVAVHMWQCSCACLLHCYPTTTSRSPPPLPTPRCCLVCQPHATHHCRPPSAAGQGHPMKPHRVRMANSLVLHYGLHSKLDGVRGWMLCCLVASFGGG